MDEKKVEGQAQPQVSNAGSPAPSGNNAKVISRFGTSSAQPKVQPIQQTQANVPPKANAAPTAPAANSTQSSTPQPAQSIPTAYHSANTSKTAQKIDPFAEQNAKRAEEKKQRSKNRKIIIIVSVIVGILVLAAITWFIIAKINQPDDKPWLDNIPSINSDSDDSVSEIQQYFQKVYNDNASGNTKKNKLESINQAVTTVIDHGKNSDYANQIILAQIQFYLSNGYYNEIIDNINKVNVDSLTPQQKLSFYNCLALTYQEQDNQPKYNEYSDLMLEISIELNGTGEYTDE